MIVNEKIIIGVNSRNLNFLKNFGYDAKVGKDIEISSIHLCKNSDYHITAKCDVCDSENIIKMRTYTKCLKCHNYYACKYCTINKSIKTNLEKYGVEFTFQNLEFVNKRKNNTIEKYGSGSTFQIEFIKEKIKLTNIEKYGFEKASQNDSVINKMKNTRIKKGLQLPDNKVPDFVLYKRKVQHITNKNKKIL